MRHAYLTVDLGYGDSGKGSIVDYLCRSTGARLVVRHSGGPQCGHNVVTEDGRHHTFAQLGSGTFAGAATYYSRFALLEPFALLNEAKALAPKLGHNPLDKLYIEEGCPVITPFHWITTRAKETARGTARHGSCGFGIGELRQDQEDNQPVITAGELNKHDEEMVYLKLRKIKALKIEQLCMAGVDSAPLEQESLFGLNYFYRSFSDKVRIVPNGSLGSMISGPVVFENAQGVLIDQQWGFEPYRSWTDVTFAKAERLLEGLGMRTTKIGILRTYATRHGAGPFPSEAPLGHPESHNGTGPWQGAFRQGHFDARMARYALRAVGGVDGLALTHLDCLGADGLMQRVEAYDRGQWDTETLMRARPVAGATQHYREIEASLKVGIMIESRGPAAGDKRWIGSAGAGLTGSLMLGTGGSSRGRMRCYQN